LLLAAGVKHVLVWDREGILAPSDPRLNDAKRELAALTNPEGVYGRAARRACAMRTSSSE